MGAQLVREVATKTNDVAGDGTTTATLLAQAIVHEGMKNVAAGANPMGIRLGIEAAVNEAVEGLKKISSRSKYLPASVLMTISGSIYVESLFSIPGMGGLLIAAIQRQDNPLVQALVLIYSSIGILGLLLGDLLMALCDPRIKLSGKGGAN